MLIKFTAAMNITPTESDEDETEEQTMFNCIRSFLDCAEMQCENQEDRCVNAECEGCKSFSLLHVEHISEG